LPLFRKEALDHKRRKLHGEVILVQPVGFKEAQRRPQPFSYKTPYTKQR